MLSYLEWRDSEPLFEMANLSPKQTNVSGGYIFISTKYEEHGCRIKFFPNLNAQNKVLIISIPDLLIVKDTLTDDITDKKRKELVTFAKKFSTKLLSFWNEGNRWDDETVTEFKSKLKLNQDDLMSSKNVKLKWK